MHGAIVTFLVKVKKLFPDQFKDKDVLEVGSWNINGSVRPFFEDCRYIGIDLNPGEDVDIVTHLLDWEVDRKFDTIISCEAMEHDIRRKESLQKMYDLLNDGGLMIVTCGNVNRPEHGTQDHQAWASPGTNDYYGNLSKEQIIGLFPSAVVEEDENKQDLYFCVSKYV